MKNNRYISVIIPALNEEESIGKVISEIPKFVDEIIVVDNGSTDNTPKAVIENGAKLITENKKGYGKACLSGIKNLKNKDIIVFLDGDYSDYPSEMSLIIEDIIQEKSKFVIGSRITGKLQKGAMPPVAQFGNWLAPFLINLFWGLKFTDLGPFRAITYSALSKMDMIDQNFGWTVEMQIKAAKLKIPCTEVSVSYRKRIGTSKVSGTIIGSVKAGYKILYLIFLNLFKKGI